MKYKASFCDPLKSEIIALGLFNKKEIMQLFDDIPWEEHLMKMNNVTEKDIYYSPSLEIENSANKHGLSVSIDNAKKWYIFYKRPKKVKKLFGLIEKLDKNYLTEINGQSITDVKTCIKALVNNDFNYLEQKIQ